MSERYTFDELVSIQRETQEVELGDTGKCVLIQALSRQQALEVADTNGSAIREHKILSFGIVEPKMTVKQAEQFCMSIPAGYINPLVTAIARLSGMQNDVERESMSTFQGESVDPV